MLQQLRPCRLLIERDHLRRSHSIGRRSKLRVVLGSHEFHQFQFCRELRSSGFLARAGQNPFYVLWEIPALELHNVVSDIPRVSARPQNIRRRIGALSFMQKVSLTADSAWFWLAAATQASFAVPSATSFAFSCKLSAEVESNGTGCRN